MARRKDVLILWPHYFDASLSRNQGRRVPKSLAVQNPKVEEIATAARDLGYFAEMDRDKAHPSTPWISEGRVLVAKAAPKSSVIQKIASTMKDQRS